MCIQKPGVGCGWWSRTRGSFSSLLKLSSAQLSRQQTCGHVEKQQIAIKHLKVIAREDSLRDSAKLTGWLYQVTRNAIVDLLRSNRRLDELRREIETKNDETGAEAKLSACLQPMIDALLETHRDAVMLSEIDGVPLKRIAEGQRISLSGAKSRVQRGPAEA